MLLKQLKDEPSSQQRLQSGINAPDVLAFFETIFRNDVRLKIVVILSNREGACLREIARNAGISHKNLAKYLEVLSQKGVVESYPVGARNIVYKLSNRYDYLRELL